MVLFSQSTFYLEGFCVISTPALLYVLYFTVHAVSLILRETLAYTENVMHKGEKEGTENKKLTNWEQLGLAVIIHVHCSLFPVPVSLKVYPPGNLQDILV